MAINAELRRLVRDRAQNRCGYCQCLGFYATSPFAVEHIHPQVHGGADDNANLAWSCGYCNGHKAAAVTAIDPETRKRTPLFNPRTPMWKEHFSWNEDKSLVIGLTITGRATAKRLRVNRDEIINLRKVLHRAGLHPPADTE